MVIELEPEGKAYGNASGLSFGLSGLDNTDLIKGSLFLYTMSHKGENNWRGHALKTDYWTFYDDVGRAHKIRTIYYDWNNITLTPDGLKMDSTDDEHRSWKRLDNHPGTLENEPSRFNGGWRRYGNLNGYQTDLQIGRIKREPVNRVYLCTLPPTPSPQLYKGTLQSDGVTIVWDSAHNVPKYVIWCTSATTKVCDYE